MYTLEELQQRGALGRNLHLIDLHSPELITLKEYQALAKEGKADGRIPILEDAQWVAVNNKGIYHAMGKDGRLSKIRKGRKDLIIQELADNTFSTVEVVNLRETQEEFDEAERVFKSLEASGELERMRAKVVNKEVVNNDINTKEIKEESVMANNVNLEGLTAGLSEALKGITEQNETQRMSIENGLPVNGTTNTTATEQITTKESLDETPVHLLEVSEFNKDNGGCLVCLVTDKDARIQATAKKPSTSKVKGGAGADYEAAGSSDASTSTEGTDNSRMLTFSQSTPGKILGGVVRVPVGGLFTISELDSGMKNGQPIEVDSSKKDLKTMLLDEETLKSFIGFGFNSEIPECKETYGKDAGTTKVEVKVTVRKDSKTNENNTYTRITLKSTRGGKVLSPNAYFPIKTFETIAVNDKLNQEQVDKLNMSAFYSLFNKTKSETTEPAAKLRLQDRALIDRVDNNGDVKFTSEFFKVDGSGIGIKVKPWYGAKNDRLPNPEIPVKEIKVNAEKQTERAVVVTINCLKDQGVPGYNEVSSLTSGRFDNVIEQSAGELSLERLKKTFGRESKSNKGRDKLATSAQQLATFRKAVLTKKTNMDLLLKKFR